jgi:DNA-binding SARP family transcriptional activator/DNA-binding beta-propeller fold protein YncE
MEFRILGPLEVVDGGRRVELGGGRQSALLALLLLHANEVVLVDRIVEELWPGGPPVTAQKIVQGYVVQLRKAVADALVTRPGGYVLRLERDQLDVARAERLLDEGRSAFAAGRVAEASEAFEHALELWRGPPLADFTYDSFAQSEIARLQELRLEILEERIETELALGRHSSLIGELEALVVQEPLRERLRAQLMIALYRSGRQAQALDSYRSAQQTLGEELGLEPGPMLRDLERSILTHDPSLAAPSRVRAALARPTRGRLLAGVLALALLFAAGSLALALAFKGDGNEAATPTRNYVTSIDPRTNRSTERIAVGERPTQIVASPSRVWLLNADSGTISAIDTRSRTRVKTSGAVGLAPTDLVFDGQALWVSDSTLRRVFRLDPDTLVVTGRPAFPPPVLRHGRRGYDPVEVGGLALGHDSLWVGGGADNLFRLELPTGRFLARVFDVPTLAGPGKALVVTRDGVWARGCCPSAITRVDEATNRVAVVRPIGSGIHETQGLAVGAGAVWVTDASADVVWKIDTQTNEIVRTPSAGADPSGIAVGFGSVWIANGGDGTVWRLDPVTGIPEAKIDVGGSPAGVAVGAGRVWVTVD